MQLHNGDVIANCKITFAGERFRRNIDSGTLMPIQVDKGASVEITNTEFIQGEWVIPPGDRR